MEILTLDLAGRIVSEALVIARRQGLRPMALVVVDEAGNLKHMAGEDGATPLHSRIGRQPRRRCARRISASFHAGIIVHPIFTHRPRQRGM
ncbi:hypothetical protein [Trinickia mobilis]|uniref:hypothetical protein n=1 Tax=Trinickia mobilis TaxID=2816356 RepID=UPI001A8FABE5|nr:hypothetical protein [Trinickia mobilis]